MLLEVGLLQPLSLLPVPPFCRNNILWRYNSYCHSCAAGCNLNCEKCHSAFKKVKEEKKLKRYNRSDLVTINEITVETSENISSVIGGINKMYTKTVDNLGYHDLNKLKKTARQ
jgi:hypothetical protein